MKHIKEEEPIFVGVVQKDKVFYLFNNESELLQYRIQIAEQRLKGCTVEFSKYPNIITIDDNGNFEEELPFKSRSFELLMKLRRIQKK